ncbi:hypothetical protein SCUCBS95973_002571 [Sporothrix curviconia]|uniref:Red-like protein n=1 Tax=Sporothrix curviconia TaxID=1260050 RepID=A0ABP0B814_9PEZI
MNNEQFRKLAFGAGASSASGAASGSGGASSSAAPKALGSRQKASIPMTPRHSDVGRVAFVRQMAERYANSNNDNNDDDAANGKKQKVRTSRPKGTQFAAGYVDRAKLRAETENGGGNDGDDDDDSSGGNRTSTHPKGLDFKLLERARRGVVGGEAESRTEDGSDVDDEFERIEGADVQAVEREKTKKKGQYSTAAPPSAAAGQKRSRDQILAEMKAAREAAKKSKEEQAAAAEPVLGSRFKKIGAPQHAGSRIEVDSRGREVLILVDEDSHEKRKVRKAAKAPPEEGGDPKEGNGTVLGMEVPEFYRKKLEAEVAAAAAKEVDIFDDVGSDYDPLAGMDSASSEGEDEEEDNDDDKKEVEENKHNNDKAKGRDAKRRRRSSSASSRRNGEVSDASHSSRGRRRRRRSPRGDEEDQGRRDKTQPAAQPRKNYFGNSTLLSESSSRGGPSLQDPSVLAALRKAKQLREASEAEAQTQALSEEAAREARLKKLLESSERDAEDLDMGFGSSRLEDTEDLDDAAGGKKVRLSTWKGGAGGRDGGDGDDGDDDDDGGAGGSRGDKGKRKRGGKKRKGDGNNAEDVMRVLERRRGEGK